ncbi:hypothetical protein NHQ30_006821 [Ciborinia camelliae]|nr:hypothetical protein NHQ30_006821 [Ciborinia camelliae]
MSRNTQRESFKTPTKSKKSKKSKKKVTDYSSDSSDSAAYDGVDDVADEDDDDEPDESGWTGGSGIEKYEEAIMRQSAEEDDDVDTIDDDTDAQGTPRGMNNYEEWAGFADSSEEIIDNPKFFEDNTQDSDTTGTPKKRVTFVINDDDSDSSISDDESVMWHPDLFENENSAQGPFLSADALPPRIARGLEDDTYNDDNGSDQESEIGWGNGNNDSSSGESDGDDSDSSGYQSDIGDEYGGDTTDDEDWKENRPEDESMPRGNSPPPPPCLGFRIQRKKGQPDVITWYHNTDIPFVILDEHGKDLLMYSSNPKTGLLDNGSPSPIRNGSMDLYNPVLNNQANIMMSAVSDAPSEFGSYHTGNPEAFFESNNSLTDNNALRPASSSSFDESEDQTERQDLQWGDLLHLDATLTDDEEEGEDGPVEPPSSTPARPTTSDGLHPLLVHLDKGTNIGAFRLNRQNENLINSNTISKDALAFGTSTIKGVKNGHLDSLTSSLAPRRKIRNQMPSSPAGDVANRKRKSHGASEGRRSHKRNRSNA